MGFRPAWTENFGFDFGFENTYTTTTAYIYFKQIYYTISAELPSQPSDFFADDVDISALNSRISKENPAGYISSIDYGRTVIVKMTSSSNKSTISAALNATFNTTNIGISAEYRDLMENASYVIDVYGGKEELLTGNTIDEIIDYIKNGMTLTENILYAKPIQYHINYLDGGSFNTGEEITYDETTYEILDASSMVIKNITFKLLPASTPEGYYWDNFSGLPDVYYGISKYNGSSWDYLIVNDSDYKTDVSTEMLNNGDVSWSADLTITDFTLTYAIDAYDKDTGTDQWMSDVKFTVNQIVEKYGYQSKFLLPINTTDNMQLELTVEWK